MKDTTGKLAFVTGGATAGLNASAPKVGQNRELRFASPSFESGDGGRSV
jgi:hypothetical protein